MNIIILTFLFALLAYATSKPLESNDATSALVEIEKQRLIKFPEDLEQPGLSDQAAVKTDEAKRILQEIEKINQALGYVKKQSEHRMPAILDSSQYLFPNTGYSQPFHVQNPQVTGANGETLLLPSIRSVKLEGSQHKASEYNRPPIRTNQNKQVLRTNDETLILPSIRSFGEEGQHHKASEYNLPPNKIAHNTKVSKISKPKNPLYFQPHQVELPAPQNAEEQKLLPTHFVIPVRLYKNTKQEYLEKYNPQEYKVKGYKIVGDIDHFYGKTKFNKTSSSKPKSTAKYHLFFLPEEVIAKNSQSDIQAISAENTSREEKLANRPYKVQSNTQAITSGNTLNATSSSQIVRKRLVPKPQKGSNTNSIISATASTVVKVTPPPIGSNGQQQQQQYQKPQQQQQQYQKPATVPQVQQVIQQAEASPSQGSSGNNGNNGNNNGIRNPNRPLLNLANGNNNNNNNNNIIRNRPLLELQNNINNINNATSNAIKTAFQNIFKLPFRQDPKPQTTTEYPLIVETMPQQQQNFYNSLANSNPNLPQTFYTSEHLQNDHYDSDYKWDDESASTESLGVEDQNNYSSDDMRDPIEKKIFGHHAHHKVASQNEALRQGGIIIQRLKVRKGGIAIAGPGGVATAGSGGTAIVGPGGYALTHPRSLTIAGPGAKVIAIPSNVDLKDALQRTNLDTQMFPREGRIVATGPTVYFSPATGDYEDDDNE